jgi:hypothetical protein
MIYPIFLIVSIIALTISLIIDLSVWQLFFLVLIFWEWIKPEKCEGETK